MSENQQGSPAEPEKEATASGGTTHQECTNRLNAASYKITELCIASRELLDWVPVCSVGSSGYLCRVKLEKAMEGASVGTTPPTETSLFNFYTRLHRGFIFSKRLRIVAAMEAAMKTAEDQEREAAAPESTQEK